MNNYTTKEPLNPEPHLELMAWVVVFCLVVLALGRLVAVRWMLHCGRGDARSVD